MGLFESKSEKLKQDIKDFVLLLEQMSTTEKRDILFSSGDPMARSMIERWLDKGSIFTRTGSCKAYGIAAATLFNNPSDFGKNRIKIIKSLERAINHPPVIGDRVRCKSFDGGSMLEEEFNLACKIWILTLGASLYPECRQYGTRMWKLLSEAYTSKGTHLELNDYIPDEFR